MATEVTTTDELTKPIVRRKQVSARNEASMRTVIETEYGDIVTDEPEAHGGTGTGPSPLQTVLGALCGCESATFRRTADELDFAYDGISFDASYSIDIRGRMGVEGVRPHFQSIKVQATVRTKESPERLAEVVELTESRCPVYNLVNDAGVRVEMLWVRDDG
jgi:uncharacterized OsmC-like protein